MTIIQSIKIHPETYVPPPQATKTHSSVYKKPEKWSDSKAQRIQGSTMKPHKTEYEESVAHWARICGGTIVGQKIHVKYHKDGPYHERIFTRLLSPEDCYVVLGSMHRPKEVQLVEVWNPDHDVFARVDPQMCAPISKD